MDNFPRLYLELLDAGDKLKRLRRPQIIEKSMPQKYCYVILLPKSTNQRTWFDTKFAGHAEGHDRLTALRIAAENAICKYTAKPETPVEQPRIYAGLF
ncbi:hypothetical protein HDE_01524 [Halotydeus destructor]|nr:hypothetical protein HDE_01524 [Halotydeus destructor]